MLDICTEDDLVEELGDDEHQADMHSTELSECAFYGTNEKQSGQTMKMDGLVNNQTFRILLDSGSTHNFFLFKAA